MGDKSSGIEVGGKQDGDASYYCEDFEWEDLRNEIETKSEHQCQYPHTIKFSEAVEEASNKDAWQSFHQRHSTGTFFKERKYLLKEFPELLRADDNARVLEVGCGSGSSILPILRQNSSIIVYACDCSMVALERAQEMVVAAIGISGAHRFKPFCCDFSIGTFPSWLCCTLCRESYQPQLEDKKGNYHLDADDVLPQGHSVTNCRVVDIKEIADQRNKQCCTGGLDFVTLIFTLSSVPLKRMPHVIKECLLTLKPGGCCFSETMIESRYCCVQLFNRKKAQKMQRVWVHGKFQKPPR